MGTIIHFTINILNLESLKDVEKRDHLGENSPYSYMHTAL